MITRINRNKNYPSSEAAQQEILDAVAGDWGKEMSNGLRVVSLGRVKILTGIFSATTNAVDVPVSDVRYAAYFHDLEGHTNMAIVEKGAKFVAKPENISGGFSFFAMV